jgi:hypothetical protein
MVDARQHKVTSDTVPIDATGVVFTADLEVFTLASLNIEGDSTADYALDVSPTGDTYFEGEETYSGTDIRDTFEITDRNIRVRVTSTGNANDEATITVQGVRS